MPGGKLLLVKPAKPAPASIKLTPYKRIFRNRKRKLGKGTVAKYVQSIMNKAVETKYVADVLQNQVLGQAASTPGGLIRLVPNLTQGTAENQRIGDRVKGIRLRNVFTFNFASSLQNNQDIVVNLWIVGVKGANSAGTIAGVTAGQFLKVGNGNNADPNDANQVNMIQMVNHYPLNTDQYTYKRHYRFRMRRGIGLATNANTSNEVAPTGVGPYEAYKVITYSCKPPTCKYNTATDQTPNNFYPVALLYATNADGSAYGDVIQYTIRRELYYKDS